MAPAWKSYRVQGCEHCKNVFHLDTFDWLKEQTFSNIRDFELYVNILIKNSDDESIYFIGMNVYFR